jgi:hypothetical protein
MIINLIGISLRLEVRLKILVEKTRKRQEKERDKRPRRAGITGLRGWRER